MHVLQDLLRLFIVRDELLEASVGLFLFLRAILVQFEVTPALVQCIVQIFEMLGQTFDVLRLTIGPMVDLVKGEQVILRTSIVSQGRW